MQGKKLSGVKLIPDWPLRHHAGAPVGDCLGPRLNNYTPKEELSSSQHNNHATSSYDRRLERKFVEIAKS